MPLKEINQANVTGFDELLMNQEKALAQLMERFDQIFTAKDSGLRKYLNRYRGVFKWFIISDYVIKAPNKINDVIAISLMPYIQSLDFTRYLVEMFSHGKDIKHTKSVDEELLHFLRSPFFFHMGILYKKSSVFGGQSREEVLEAADQQVMYLKQLIQNEKTPLKVAAIERHLKRSQSLKKAASSKTFSLNTYRLIIFISTMVGYFSSLIATNDQQEYYLGWVSDRDKIVSSFDRYIIAPYEAYFRSFQLLRCQEDVKAKQLFMSDKEDATKPEFDFLVRVPDYIAGTLASLDFEQCNAGSEKHDSVLTKVIAENPFVDIHKMCYNKDLWEHKAVKINLKNEFDEIKG